ncbi:MAG: hypothetical protein LBE98_00130 [Puniceicoccales bacterium]|jgi:hypothetical protein|nr:hypothetical protein [Puniceicoccales bacterium]
MNNINIGSLPIEIVKVYNFERVDIRIGKNLAAIMETTPFLAANGMVYLVTVDYNNSPWESMISCGGVNGCTDDKRILQISNKVNNFELTERDVGTIYPPEE